MFMTEQEVQTAVRLGHRFSQNYHYLHCVCLRRGELLFNCVPKLHWLVHLVASSAIINPRVTRSYLEESTVGLYARAVRGIMAGGHWQGVVQSTLLRKFLLGLELRSAEMMD